MTQAELATVRCVDPVDTVITNLENAATAAGLTVLARINHRASAADVGLELRPTELLIFGNPRAGTALMLDQQTAELDLPFRALVWEDEAGQVWLTYPEPASLARCHNLAKTSEPVLAAIRDGMSSLLHGRTRGRRP